MQRRRLVIAALCLGALAGCDQDDPGHEPSAAGDGGGTAGRAGSDGGADAAGGDAGRPPPEGGQGAAGTDGASDAGPDGSSEPNDAGDAGEIDSGADAGADAGSASCPDGPYLPMAVGNRWTYRVRDSGGAISTKTTTVEGREQVGGDGPHADETAFHVVTEKTAAGVTDTTESWQDVLDDGSVVRYRELGFKPGTTQVNSEDVWDPYKLRFDQSPEHTADGATWNEAYTETKLDNGVPGTPAARSDGWVVDDVDVPCGPVGGEMRTCIKVRKTVDGAASGKTYYFARCVGKVREEGTQVEELTDFSVEQ